MSTATTTYDRPPLYAVPAPSKKRFALLLAVRAAGRRAFDLARSLPRSAARWALNGLRNIMSTLGQLPGLSVMSRLPGLSSGLGSLARAAVATVRGVGVIPTLAAVLSTPTVTRHAIDFAIVAGNHLATFGRWAWSGVNGLLRHAGSTGEALAVQLTSAGTAVARILGHPVTQVLQRAATAVAGLARPVSQSVVAHRLLRLVVPIGWLRTIAEVLLVPLLLDGRRAVPTSVATTAQPTIVPSAAPTPPADAAGAPATSTVHTASVPAAPAAAADPGTDGATDVVVGEVEPANRAARRAQQRQQAQAKHTRPHR